MTDKTDFRSELRTDILHVDAIVEKINYDSMSSSPWSNFPSVMWHYTNPFAFASIVTSGCFWMNHRKSMSDPNEIKHFMRIFAEVLMAKCRGKNMELEIFAQTISYMFDKELDQVPDAYLLSLCVLRDDVGQWEQYGCNGLGYAFGFDVIKFTEGFYNLCKEITPSFSMRSVKYGEKEARILANKISRAYIPMLEKYINSNVQENLRLYASEKLGIAVMLSAMRFASRFKKFCYRKECEIRLVEMHISAPPGRVKTRDNGAKYVAYDWRSFARDSLKEIAVGPHAPLDAEKKVKNALVAGSFDLQHIQVWRSKANMGLYFPVQASEDFSRKSYE